jgi:hypothetical protein
LGLPPCGKPIQHIVKLPNFLKARWRANRGLLYGQVLSICPLLILKSGSHPRCPDRRARYRLLVCMKYRRKTWSTCAGSSSSRCWCFFAHLRTPNRSKSNTWKIWDVWGG